MPILHIPYHAQLVSGAGSKEAPIRGEGNGVHWLGVVFQSVEAISGLRVPQTDGGVKRGTADWMNEQVTTSAASPEARIPWKQSRWHRTAQAAIAPAVDGTHVASTRGAFGLLEPPPVGLHLSVYTSPMWSARLWREESCFVDQILAVRSSEQEARRVPLLSHCTQLTPFYQKGEQG